MTPTTLSRSRRRAAFLRGFSRPFDITGTRRRRLVLASDEEALLEDWYAVGDDLRAVMRRFDATRA